jgi:hypothetical protein
VVVSPDLGKLTFLDFASAPEFIVLGEAAARASAAPSRLRWRSTRPR